MKADGTAARQVTCGDAGARQPVYQSTVYTITPTNVEPWVQVAFVGENPGERNEAGVAPEHEPVVVQDGRDGAAAADLQPLERPGPRGPARRPDGLRGLAAVAGARADGTAWRSSASTSTARTTRPTPGTRARRVKRMPAPTPSGLVVFVEADGIDGDGAGRLASVSQARPLHSHRSLTGEGDGLFRAPSPLPDGRVLVAWRPADRSGRLRHLPLRPGDRRAREGLRASRAGTRCRRSSSRPARCPTRARASSATTTPRASSTRSTSASRRRARAAEGSGEEPAGRRGRAGDRRSARGAASPRRDPARGGRLLPGAGPGQHAGAARAPRRLRDGAAHLRLDLGAQPRGAGLRRLPRGPGAHAAEPADEGPAGARAGAPPAAREAPHSHRRSRARIGRRRRRSVPSSSRSTPEDSHEAPPRLRRRRPASRRHGRARAGPGGPAPAPAARLHRGDRARRASPGPAASATTT